MQLIRYARVLRHRMGLIVIGPILAALVAGVASFLLPPVYEAQAQMVARPAQLLSTTDSTAADAGPQLHTYVNLVTTVPLLEKVSADLALNMKPMDLLKKINVTVEPSTEIIDVNVQDPNPALARDIANQLVADFTAHVNTIQTQGTVYPFSLATLPDKPVSPNKPLNIAAAFAGGLGVAVGIAFLLASISRSSATSS